MLVPMRKSLGQSDTRIPGRPHATLAEAVAARREQVATILGEVRAELEQRVAMGLAEDGPGMFAPPSHAYDGVVMTLSGKYRVGICSCGWHSDLLRTSGSEWRAYLVHWEDARREVSVQVTPRREVEPRFK